MRVGVFIDGFNLYYGIRAMSGHRHLWLDIEAMSLRLLRVGQELTELHYFTAMVRDQPVSMDRQERYLEALRANSPSAVVHLGRFQQKNMTCRGCGNTYRTYEEKESDVCFASRLVESTANGGIEMALLVTADSDFVPAILAAKRLKDDLRVVVAFPPKRHSDDLKRICDAFFTIGQNVIRKSQLPARVALSEGLILERPDYWR